MSERKKEIFKENSINKNSSCPNTPSSFNGELKGRENLSNVSATKPCQDKAVRKNKPYSAIGINQKLFKQNSLEKKKASVPQPTKRDLLLLETLESYGVLSTKQIRELIFKGINTRTVLRRLRLLKQRGFIYSSEGLPSGALAWTLSKRSSRLDLKTKIINKNSLQHDVAVSSIRIQLERLKIAESWTSEHILKKEVIKSHYEERRNSLSYMDDPPLIPDSLFITRHEGEMKAVALELELTLKSRERYKKIFSQYKEKEKIWFVWYVVLTHSAGEALSRLWAKYAIWGNCLFAYSTLEELFKYDFKLPEPRDEDLRETKREEREKWL